MRNKILGLVILVTLIASFLGAIVPEVPVQASGSGGGKYSVENIALGKPIIPITNNEYTGYGDPSDVTDGTLDSTWYCYQMSNYNYCEFILDLGATYYLNDFEIWLDQTYRLTISVSTITDDWSDEDKWSDCCTYDCGGSYSGPISIPLDNPMPARYIHYFAEADHNQYIGLTEMEVYGWKVKSGSVWAWGNNEYGQLGVDSVDSNKNYTPSRVRGYDNVDFLTDITAISAGEYHNLALKTDGTVWAWGLNDNGQLGDFSIVERDTPVQVLTESDPTTPLSNIVAMAAGQNHSLAVDTYGQVWSWGRNDNGQLGYSTGIYRAQAQQVTDLSGTFTSVAAGDFHSLALKEDGTIWAWGNNGYGQLGDGSTESSTIPVQVMLDEENPLTDVQAVCAGYGFSLALAEDGTVWAWGYNGCGQLATSNTDSKSYATHVKYLFSEELLTNITAVSAGESHVLALRDDGYVYSWGWNSYGQLGNYNLYPDPAYIQTFPEYVWFDQYGNNCLHDIKAISAGGDHSLAVSNDNTIWTWGDNFSGQASSENEKQNIPFQIPELNSVYAIAAGGEHSLIIKTPLITTRALQSGAVGRSYSQTLKGTGDGDFEWSILGGELPDGLELTGDTISGTPELSGRFDFLVQLTDDNGTTSQSLFINIVSAGIVKAWGLNEYGELGIGSEEINLWTPQDVNAVTDIISVSAGRNHSLAADIDGNAWAWGNDSSGQLGNGIASGENVLIPFIVENLSDVVSVSASKSSPTFSLALKEDGNVWSWGGNYSGTLGDGTDSLSTSPVHVVGSGGEGYLTDIVAISAGGLFSIALKADGTVWTWGDGYFGQLGNGLSGNNIFSLTPVQVYGLEDVVAISAGYSHGLAIKEDGTVWAWGKNAHGQLGNDSTTNSAIPVQVQSEDEAGYLTDIISVNAGGSHSMAIDSNGNVWAWGRNDVGELGNGNYYNPDEMPNPGSDLPVQSQGITDVTCLSSGGIGATHEETIYGDTSFAVKADGTAWGWGYNSNGHLGTGELDEHPVPVQITDLNGVFDISGGYYHTLAIVTPPDPPTFITTALRPGIIYMDYSQILAAEGGEGDYTWSISSGALPYGMNIDESTGEISGIPEEGGTFNFTVEVSASGSESTRAFTLAVKEPGQPWAFGHNGHEQLGHETANDYSDVPVVVQNLENGAVDVAGGSFSSYAIATNGTVWAWGRNFEGQLGNGSSGNGTDTSTPQQVSGLSGIVAIDGGMYHATALKSDGTVWVWGSNSNGQLGNGETGGLSSTPIQVSDLSDIVAISTGDYFNLALKSDGSVWGWGSNSYYQMGSEGGYTIATPIEIEGLPDEVKAISGGGGHILALTIDNEIWANGWNDYGQLGNNTTNSSSTPVQVNSVEGLDDIQDIAAGGMFSLALTSTGEVWGWGSNRYGMLGFDPGTDNPSGSMSLIPIKVEGISEITAISANCYQSLALDSNGTAWSWGSDNWGQLGDGDGGDGVYDVYSFVPDEILNMTDVLTINSAFTHSLLLTNAPITIISGETLPKGTVNKAYSTTLVANGGILPYSWAIIEGNLPPGLNLESPIVTQSENTDNTATISGTPTAAGTYTFTVRVTDSTLIRDASEFSVQQVEENPDTKTFTITIANASTGGGGGGGGGGSSITLVTNGCGAPSPIKLNSSGYALSAAQITTPDGNVILGLKYWTHMMASAASVLIHMDVSPLTAPPAAPAGRAFVYAYSFGPEGATFNPALTITMKYNLATLPANIIEKSLYIAYFDGTSWQKLDSTVDTANKTVTAQITHFSNYALMGEVTAPATTVAPSPTAAETPTVKPSPSPTSKPSATPTASATASPIVTAAPTTPVYSPATTEIPTTTSRTEPTPANNWLIWVIIVVIVALLTAIVFIWRRRSTHS